MFRPMLTRDTGDPVFWMPNDPVTHVPACVSYKKPILAHFLCSLCEMCASAHISHSYPKYALHSGQCSLGTQVTQHSRHLVNQKHRLRHVFCLLGPPSM
jgi:hypothetical protein